MSLKSLFTSLTKYANRRTRDSRSLRKVGIWVYSSALRRIVLPPPRVLLNGPAKSGTHLLSDCLSSMPKMMFSGRHFALPEFMVPPHSTNRGVPTLASWRQLELDEARLEKYLNGCPQGMFVTAHAHFHPVLRDILEKLEFQQLVLLRDPRDVVISSVLSPLKRQPWHHAHRFFFEVLKSDEERIMVSIRGVETDHAPKGSKGSIRSIFDRYMEWLDEPWTLMVRFEDLVGPRGGGETEKQIATIERIAEFLGRPVDRAGAMTIAQRTYGTSGLTFRRGTIGDWQNHFTEEHRQAFKDVAGDILVGLGYEEDMNW